MSYLDEMQRARAYVAERSEKALGFVLTEADPLHLWNTQSDATYVILPLPDGQRDGYYVIGVQAGASHRPPGFHDMVPDWAGILEPDSTLHLLPYAILQQMAADPDAYAGQIHRTVEPDYIILAIPKLLAQQELFRRSVPLGAGPTSYALWRSRSLAGSDEFVHLHVHSMYSLLDGVPTPTELAAQAVANGQDALAITDHGYMFGAYNFTDACQAHGIKPVLGVEAYLVDDVDRHYQDASGKDRRFEHHITLLAQNQTGWRNLNELLSTACRDHFYSVPRIDHKRLFALAEGVIVLGGCFKGPVAWYLQHHEPEPPMPDGTPTTVKPWAARDVDRAWRYMLMYKEALGDRYFVEVQHNDFARYMQIVPEIVEMAARAQVPCVVTNDVHYAAEADAILQATMTHISRASVDDGIGDSNFETGPYYLKRSEAMAHPCFTPDMFTRSCEIAARCAVDISFTEYLFPNYDVTRDSDWAAYQAAREALV
jgi:hypothetical protein